jgi:iron complex outermembrane receptor protein
MTAPANVLYDQHSRFDTAQPFVDLEWDVTSQLTVTPGLKYVDFWRRTAGPFNQGTRNAVPQSDHQAKLLYFATANYRIQPNWSVYAQFATGFLQAPLSVLQSSNANTTALKPQQTTNYQLGTVFQSHKLTIDGDLYYITFNNLLSSFTNVSSFTGAVCPVNETCFENVPGATYDGVEGEATVAMTDQLFGFVNGSYNNATNNRTHMQIAGAPKYTFAAGGIFKSAQFEASLIDKLVGDIPQVDAGCAANSGPCVRNNLFAYNFYRIRPYNQLDLTGVFHFGHFRVEAAVYNLLNSQQPFKVTPASKKIASAADPNIPFDQEYFQPPINYQFSVRYTF